MRRGLLLVLLALTAACASGGGPRPPIPIPPEPVGTLAVSVTDPEGHPVAGARFAPADAGMGIEAAQTNGDGYAAITPFPLNRTVHMTLTAEGFLPWDADINITGNHQFPVTFQRPPPLTPWAGQLRLAPGARTFVDATGQPVLPVLAHFGEAFSAFVHAKSVGGLTVEQQLRTIKLAGYDGVRFWDTLGYYQMAWQGREVMPWAFTVCHDSRWSQCDGHTQPATPDYYPTLERFLGLVKTTGLTTHHSRGDLNGQSTSRVVSHVEQVAQIYDRVGASVAALCEGNNEDWQNGGFGPDGLRRIVAPCRARGILTALSAPPDSSEEPSAIVAYASDVFYVHGFRNGEAADRLRHIFSLAREQAAGTPRLGWQGEPTGPGPGVTVGRTDDPEELALLAVQAWLSRQAWVYMSSHGVFWNGRIEDQPGFWAVPRMRAVLMAFAPDVMAWRQTHASTAEAVLTSPTGTAPPNTEGPARIDQAIAGDGRVVALVYGGRGRRAVRNNSGRAMEWQVVSLSADEHPVIDTFRVEAGQSLDLTYRVGRLILARPVS